MSEFDLLKLAVNVYYFNNRMKDYKEFYYIDKKWYEDWEDYVNMDFIIIFMDDYYNSSNNKDLNLKQFIEIIKDEYSPKKYNAIIPKGPINKEIKYIPKEKMLNYKKVIDESFYIKINNKSWNLLKKYYGY